MNDGRTELIDPPADVSCGAPEEVSRIRGFIEKIKQLSQRRLAKDASWMMLGQGVSFTCRAAYFFVLARLLGAVEFGIFAGVFALVNVAAPYSALGAATLFMRYVTRDKSTAPVYWGNALITTITMSAILVPLFAAFGPRFMGLHGAWLIINVVLANCLCMQISTVASKVFQTYGRMRLSSVLVMLPDLTRFALVIGMVATMPRATALEWSAAVLFAAALTTAFAVYHVHALVGRTSYNLRTLTFQMGEGLSYTLGSTSQAIYNNFDKSLLTHYGMNRQNGFYTLAYRVIDFVCTPVAAVQSAVMPRFFLLSHKSPMKVARLAYKTVITTASLNMCIGATLWFLSPLIPRLVGRDFGEAVLALRWLSVIPFLRAIHVIAGSSITAMGSQRLRLGAQFSVAALNLVLDIWLIPKHGWRGAAWASVASDGMLAALSIVLVTVITQRAAQRERYLPAS